ncbi:hypothetical protein SOASR030_04560 [Leminorella grimontii]|uniref:Uncharacterized protein n=1 Tax=Leminorella grimontii TaxID=82981 RepID=A0AAV5MZX7_9GAMM|nr:SinI family autotransporter-associated protein [Leminorella grimontii]KFC96459.1 SinI family protein [Leminorella grimontii ATCC 33999 = DSM 5078]GKX54344.1 hypothetical protein SOASR030_04560 [Leminorella grimontii]VFS59504.1 intimin-like protein SinH [Leminorella grimontii]
MRLSTKRRLTKVALALVVAGYCSTSAIAAGNLKSTDTNGWQVVTQNTGSIEGTVPWITRSVTETTEADKGHVTVTVDRGGRTASTTGEKQFHIGDKVTVNWAIGDTEGDLDNDNTATKGTVVWLRSKSQDGSDAVEISGSAGKDTYTITNDDADYYLGIKIKPTTTTGTPNQAVDFLTLVDLSTNAGGGSNDDDIPEGPVVDDSVKVAIYEDGSSTNLLGTSTALKTSTTYKVRLWKDANNNDVFDAGETDVTDQYDYRWKFTGTSLQLHANGGYANESTNNAALAIPATNAEAKAQIFSGAGEDGVQGYGLSIEYKRK